MHLLDREPESTLLTKEEKKERWNSKFTFDVHTYNTSLHTESTDTMCRVFYQ